LSVRYLYNKLLLNLYVWVPNIKILYFFTGEKRKGHFRWKLGTPNKTFIIYITFTYMYIHQSNKIDDTINKYFIKKKTSNGLDEIRYVYQLNYKK